MEWLYSRRRFQSVNRFYRRQKGGLALIFAILLPFIFSCCALVFDGSRLLIKRARLADALNEAALVIATTSTHNPDSAELHRLETLLDGYITAYLPADPIVDSHIAISYRNDPIFNKDVPVFDIRAKIKVKTLLPLETFPAFSSSLELTNSGKVRKGIFEEVKPADYVFVVDFSGSMDDPSAEAGLTRLELLKKVINDTIAMAMNSHPDTTFSFVPFNQGVPVLLDASALDYPGNELSDARGSVIGCSVLMVPNEFYHTGLQQPVGNDINYAFWSNKTRDIIKLPEPSDSSTTLPYTLDEVNQLLDAGRYNYFARHVLPGLQEQDPSADWNTLVKKGWCKENKGVPEPSYNCAKVRPLCVQQAPYSCEKNPHNSIFTSENQKIIKNEIERARRVFKQAAELPPNNTLYGSIYHLQAINVPATLNGMFDPANIINFSIPYGSAVFDYALRSPYAEGMCIQGKQAKKLADVETTTYLIEPTNDINRLNALQTMQAGGGTNSSSGLLRAVPELAKGRHSRKVMVIISDGDDNESAQPLTDALHKTPAANFKVCDRIRSGLKKKPGVTDAEIYFISVVDDADALDRQKYWADYCTGSDKAFIATDYSQLMDALIGIVSGYEETGYFYN